MHEYKASRHSENKEVRLVAVTRLCQPPLGESVNRKGNWRLLWRPSHLPYTSMPCFTLIYVCLLFLILVLRVSLFKSTVLRVCLCFLGVMGMVSFIFICLFFLFYMWSGCWFIFSGLYCFFEHPPTHARAHTHTICFSQQKKFLLLRWHVIWSHQMITPQTCGNPKKLYAERDAAKDHSSSRLSLEVVNRRVFLFLCSTC